MHNKKNFVCIATVNNNFFSDSKKKIRYKSRFQKWCNRVGVDLFDLTAMQQILGSHEYDYLVIVDVLLYPHPQDSHKENSRSSRDSF